MKNSNAVENYFQDVIKKSWTWNRLTEAEYEATLQEVNGIK